MGPHYRLRAKVLIMDLSSAVSPCIVMPFIMHALKLILLIAHRTDQAASEIVQPVKALVAKPDDLGSVSNMHVEGKDWRQLIPTSCPVTSTYALLKHAHACTHTINKCNLKINSN